jgi:hypothetical protein
VITASQLDRVIHCPASAALPQVRQRSDAADFGSGVHAFLKLADKVGREAALAEIAEDAPHRDLCEQLPLDELPKGGRREVAFARNRITGAVRILGEGEHRDYSDVTEDEDCGTADLIGTKNGRGIVKDWKSGRHVGNPATAAQLLFFALCVAEIAEVDEVEVAFVYLRDDGTFYEDCAVVDSFDLAAFAETLRTLPKQIEAERGKIYAGRQPDVFNGPWCRFCPAAAACPAKTALARSFGAELVSIRDQVSALSSVDAGKVYQKALEYKDLLEEVIAGLRDVARVSPLELPDGRVLRETLVKLPTKVDANVAEEVLTELHGEKLAREAVTIEKSVTLTAIEGALRKMAQPGQLAKLKKQAIEKVRQRGGLREGTVPQVRITKGE